MATRRTFVPENPACLSLETRLTPSSSGWLNHTFNQIGHFFSVHHHNTNAAAGIEQMWKDTAKADHAAKVAQAHHAKAK
jgi:hypothetical protein